MPPAEIKLHAETIPNRAASLNKDLDDIVDRKSANVIMTAPLAAENEKTQKDILVLATAMDHILSTLNSCITEVRNELGALEKHSTGTDQFNELKNVMVNSHSILESTCQLLPHIV